MSRAWAHESRVPAGCMRALVDETHEKICPYSHATRGNIDIKVEVEGAG